MIPAIPALQGRRQDLYWQAAQAFFDAPHGRVSIKDFGDVKERAPISPIIAYLRRRGSVDVRIQVGLSVRKNGQVYGAILSDKRGDYRWDPDYRWPSVGEVDAMVIEAQEKARRREVKSARASRIREEVVNEDIQLTFSDPPSLRSGGSPPPAAAPPAPTPTEPPSVAPAATQAPLVADESACRLLALTDSVVVLQTADKIIVADVKSVSTI